MTLAAQIGCPSGLEPPADIAPAPGAADPRPFVRTKNGVASLELAVFGAKCAGCIAKIEGAMRGVPGVESARLNLSTGRLTLAWREGAVEARNLVVRLGDLGYRVAPYDREALEAEDDETGRALLRALGVAGFGMANVMLLSVSVWAGGGEMGPGVRGLMHWVSALIALPAALYAGRPFFRSAWGALKVGRANMDVPISLAVFLALGISVFEFFTGGAHAYFDAALMLLFFLLIGRYLDHRLRQRARAAARDLMALQATTASRLSADGSLTPVAAREIEPGDLLLLSPGDRAPVDGAVREGASDVDVSLVTGESAPQRFSVGDRLYAGALNQSARLVVEATARVEDSLVAEIARLIEAGEQTKSRYVRLADRAAALYVPTVHTLALATFLGWCFLFDGGARVAIMNAVAVLIITCPCALGLAAPAVQVVATGRLFRAGVLVKSGDALERLAQADTFVFDKTGTLTLGAPALVNSADISEEALQNAAALARVSRHPLSRALVAAAGPGKPAADAVERPGYGIEGTIDGPAGPARARLGKAAWLGFTGAPQTEDQGALETWYQAEDGRPATRFVFRDPLRADAVEAVRQLKDLGCRVEMLSGDRPAVAQRIADALGIGRWRAGLSPQHKTARLAELAAQGRKTAMAGDGLNDAPSLACAHASLSPGTAADASQAAADFVYQGAALAPVVETVCVARAAKRRVLENFAFAACYNAVAAPLAMAGHVTPLIAALAMSGSSMIVTLNALRLSRGSAKRRRSTPAEARIDEGLGAANVQSAARA